MFIEPATEDIFVSIEFKNNSWRTMAIAAHGSQMYGNLHYSYHLSSVENILVEHGFDDNVYRAAAWLHDVLEDTKVTYSQIVDFYGNEIAQYVFAVTGEGPNRTDRAISIFNKLRTKPEAAPVKVADRIANIAHGIATNNTRKLSMYLKEWETFKYNVEPLMLSNKTSKSAYLWSELEDLIERAKLCIRMKM